jgi:hypothetical protein
VTPHTVYRMYAADGELLYIGCTHNPTIRMQRHPVWLLARTASITFEWHPDRDTGRAAETRAIHTENPALNRRSHPHWKERTAGKNWYQSQVNRVTSGNLWCVAGLHRKQKQRPTSTNDYAAMLRRMIVRYGDRIGEDPVTGLAALRDLEQAMTDSVNVGIHAAHLSGHSYNQLATQLDVSKAAIVKRAKLGEAALRQRERIAASRTRRAVPTAPIARPRELPPA